MVQFLAAVLLLAQTIITPPENKYTPAQDVELGRQAANQIERELPLMRDDLITSYVTDLGRRLTESISPELRHSEFRYTFQVVNVREINAFALPGGPMYVNRGMLEAARSEAEVVGVMAHELSHVILRHGTAQASKATKYELGALAGAVLGAIVGGRVGSVISEGTRFGIGTAFLRFSREFEQQADLEGTHIMARSGYDPRAMAEMFKTIERQGGSSGPQWLSDHPNPGNRIEYITREASMLRVQNPVTNTSTFEQAQRRLKQMPRAPTTEEATKRGAGRRGSDRPDSPPAGRVDPPSSRYIIYNEADLFRVSIPENWRELQSSSSVTFAPEGAYGSIRGQDVFTHGVEMGIVRNETHNLRTATDEFLDSLSRSNPSLTKPRRYDRTSIDSRSALHATMSNVSAAEQSETVELFTTLLGDGSLFYVIGAAPRAVFADYDDVFQRIVESIRFSR
jgi:hypothetical protein